MDLAASNGGDLFDGYIDLGETKISAKLLGTVNPANDTWLWAWANPQAGLPETILAPSLALKNLGNTEEIELLTDPGCPNGTAMGHQFSAIAVGSLGAKGYVEFPLGGPNGFLLIDDDRIPDNDSPALLKAMMNIPAAVQSYPVQDHRAAVLGYAHHLDLLAEISDEEVSLVDTQRGGSVVVSFDQKNRFTGLNSTIK